LEFFTILWWDRGGLGSSPIYDIYFDDNYDVNYCINNDNNDNDDVINDALIGKLYVEYKKNMKGS
jgi:hypothetical protein